MLMIIILSGTASWSAETFRRNKERFQNKICSAHNSAQHIPFFLFVDLFLQTYQGYKVQPESEVFQI